MKEKFIIGSIVKAIAGREKNQLFVVLKIENSWIHLVDGKTRKLEKPKKKNIKHINLLKKHTYLEEKLSNNTITNGDIIKKLKDYKSYKSKEANIV